MATTGNTAPELVVGTDDEDPAGIGSDALSGPPPVPAEADDEREIDPDGD